MFPKPFMTRQCAMNGASRRNMSFEPNVSSRLKMATPQFAGSHVQNVLIIALDA